MSAAVLTRELKQRAVEAGFDAVGVAAASTLDRDGAALAAWLRAGREASMAWMARDPEKRADPRRLLPGCRSVVVLAMNYWPGKTASRPVPGRARVALYARGRDYHKVMGKPLKHLAGWLEQRSGLATRSFVDTGPVLERGWAERAGIGWIGKNANLLTRDRGSWLLLGEILTAAELDPDPGPHADHCGSCTACMESCPTDAIVGDAVIDSNRCIAYWTIEHRGPIPEQRRATLDDWIFGCDLCQQVCPWNVSSAQVAADRFGLRADLQGLDAAAILEMTEQEFRARYSGTSLMRAKWEGMRRNACLVLANRNDPSGLPALSRALADDDEVVRSHAAWAIERISRGLSGQAGMK